MGVVDGPILATLAKYFEQRRAFANGIAFAGSSVGSLVIAPLTSLLIGKYSIRGATLLLGGLWLNICVIGALLRPIDTGAAGAWQREGAGQGGGGGGRGGGPDEGGGGGGGLVEEGRPVSEGVGGGGGDAEREEGTDPEVPEEAKCDVEVNVIPCAENNEGKREEGRCDDEEEEEENDRWKKPEPKMVTSQSEHVHLKARLIQDLHPVLSSPSNGALGDGFKLSNPVIKALKIESGLCPASVLHKPMTKTLLATSLPDALHVQHTLPPRTPELHRRQDPTRARSLFGSNVSIPSLLYRGESILDLSRPARTAAAAVVAMDTTNNNHVVAKAEEAQGPDAGGSATYLEFLFNPTLLRELFILGCGCYAYYTPIVAFPAYGREMGIDTFEIAWTVGLIGERENGNGLSPAWFIWGRVGRERRLPPLGSLWP